MPVERGPDISFCLVRIIEQLLRHVDDAGVAFSFGGKGCLFADFGHEFLYGGMYAVDVLASGSGHICLTTSSALDVACGFANQLSSIESCVYKRLAYEERQ